MRILLLGHIGFLGSFLHNNLNVDVIESDNRRLQYNGEKYDYVINCVGKPDLIYCENDLIESEYSNKNIVSDIINFYPNAKIINFSSYYVYDEPGLANENSNVTTYYNYTRQKLEGENINKFGVNFRLGKLFGHWDITKQYKLTEHIILSDHVIVDNIQFNPTSLYQVLKVVLYELKNQNLFGIYNLSNDGLTTHYEYAKTINDIMGTNKEIYVTENYYSTFTNYGKFAMDCSKLKNNVNLEHWKKDLELYLNSLSYGK